MTHLVSRAQLTATIWAIISSTSIAQTIDIGWNAASLPDGTVANWNTDTNNFTPPATWNGSGTKTSGTSNFANVNDWINTPNYDLSLTGGGDSWHELTTDPTQTNATWELVFRPGSFSGNRHIFNTGGNWDGVAFVIEDSILRFIFQDADNANQQINLSFDLSTIGSASDFYHIIGTSDVDSAASGTGELWVNGTSVAGPTTSSGTINDWAGGNTANIGSDGTAGDAHQIPSDNSYASEAFTGDLAIINFYGGEILDQTQINNAFNNLIPEPSSSILCLIGLGSISLRRQRK